MKYCIFLYLKTQADKNIFDADRKQDRAMCIQPGQAASSVTHYDSSLTRSNEVLGVILCKVNARRF